MTALLAGAPLLAVGFVAGIIVSLVQILTSIQDSAFSAIPRLLAFLGAFILAMPWMLQKMTRVYGGHSGGPGPLWALTGSCRSQPSGLLSDAGPCVRRVCIRAAAGIEERGGPGADPVCRWASRSRCFPCGRTSRQTSSRSFSWCGWFPKPRWVSASAWRWRFAIEAFMVGAQMIGLQAGYSFASTVDPSTQADSTVLVVFAQTAAGLPCFSPWDSIAKYCEFSPAVWRRFRRDLSRCRAARWNDLLAGFDHVLDGIAAGAAGARGDDHGGYFTGAAGPGECAAASSDHCVSR